MRRYFFSIGLLGIFTSFSYATEIDLVESCAAHIKFYDNLKMCNPSTLSFKNPLFPDTIMQNIIDGKKGDKCLVTFLFSPDNKNVCELSQQTIKFMTTDEKYKEMRECKSFAGSEDDPAVIGLVKECTTLIQGMSVKQGEPTLTIDTTKEVTQTTPNLVPVKPESPAPSLDMKNYYKDYPLWSK